MALKIPPSFRLKDLKNVAFKCGISTSGTKSTLTQRLNEEIVLNHGFKATPSRILSIDMGIRNLAYCILELPSAGTRKSKLPRIAAWRRIAVSSVPAQDLSSSLPPTKEAFDPQTLSTAAYTLLRHTLLPYEPTHILIERQRFRTLSSPHILEWTIRVNMFESMIYATLHTLKAENIWQGLVVPIAPRKVGPFWLEPLSEQLGPSDVKVRNTKSAKSINKGAKIDLVKNWLEGKDMISIGSPDVEQTSAAYLTKWHKLPGRRGVIAAQKLNRTEVGEEAGKLDDLADSLLQGMAWIRWEENKQLALENGVESLT